MKIWKMQEMRAKIFQDLDLLDETFISLNELSGYFNDAITEAKSEISDLNKDYFLTKYFVPLVVGQGRYLLPDNILANKIRGIMYQNGSIIYPVVQYRRRYNFQNIGFTDQYGQADDYRHLLVNDVPGQAQLEIHPVSRETAILPPAVNSFTPMVLWYTRDCARVPMIALNGDPAEYCNPEFLAPSSVNLGSNFIQTQAGTTNIGVMQQFVTGAYPGSIPYVTGDQVVVKPAPGGTLPAPLVDNNTPYFIIALGNGQIKLATSLQNALNNVPLTLTSQGTVAFTLYVAATQAIVFNTIIDIPEFAPFIMQYVKCQCMVKDKDQTLPLAIEALSDMKKEMIDGLTNAIPDDDDEIIPDFSSYQEMS